MSANIARNGPHGRRAAATTGKVGEARPSHGPRRAQSSIAHGDALPAVWLARVSGGAGHGTRAADALQPEPRDGRDVFGVYGRLLHGSAETVRLRGHAVRGRRPRVNQWIAECF